MATFITKRCPSCGAMYEHRLYAHYPSKDNRTKYGSPIRNCIKCGCHFKDDEYREIAISGIRDVDQSVVSPYNLFFGIFGLLFIIFGMNTGVSLGIVAAMFLFFEFPVLSNILSFNKRQRALEAERMASEKRLQDPVYVMALRNVGFFVPAKYLSGSSNAEVQSGSQSSTRSRYYFDISTNNKADKKKTNRKHITYLVVFLGIFAGILGYYAFKEFSQGSIKLWQAEMEEASLFSVSPEAGQKMVVYEQKREPDSLEFSYEKHYLPSEKVAGNPSDVGYIVVVNYEYNVVGTYANSLTTTRYEPAYRVDTVIQVYDRHSGRYLDTTEVLEGGNPPSSIKMSKSYGTGTIANESQIRNAVSIIIADL